MRYLTALATLTGCLLANVAAGSVPPPVTATTPSTISAAVAESKPSAAETDYTLPELGVAGGVALPLWKAHFMGEQVYHLIQGEGGVLNDPLVEDYIDHLGHRLSSVAQGPQEQYHYFVVNDPGINAFALPGAFVGVNFGLILATRKEDELAGVLAHETAHVAQRHIARQMADSSYNNLVNLAILLGGLATAVVDPGIAAGALMGAEGGMEQRSINYTRAHEMEADRVGILILARARFNPQGMVNFFNYMQSQANYNGFQLPEFLSTHPVDLTRIAEAEIRARHLHPDVLPENPNYALMRARIRVLTSDDPASTLSWFQERRKTETNAWYRDADTYGMVLCLNRLDSGERALKLIRPLADAHPDNIALQLALAKSLLAAHDIKAGLDALSQDNVLYPGNRPVLSTYARAQYDNGHAVRTIQLLEPLLQEPDKVWNPDLYRLLANAANKAGRHVLSLRAIASAYELEGNYRGAIVQLRLALRDKSLSPVEREQIERQKKAVTAEQKEAKKLH